MAKLIVYPTTTTNNKLQGVLPGSAGLGLRGQRVFGHAPQSQTFPNTHLREQRRVQRSTEKPQLLGTMLHEGARRHERICVALFEGPRS